MVGFIVFALTAAVTSAGSFLVVSGGDLALSLLAYMIGGMIGFVAYLLIVLERRETSSFSASG
ncbi:MAG: hypothetical protein OIF38_05260 [Cellvibrionaceae bacterium]|nr:hypothetical protein [Cellvibrionaceae bacterium]